MKVYLAGKISRDDWRKHIDGYRPFSIDASDVADNENDWNVNMDDFEKHFGELPVISKYPCIQVTGPFFLSCDHGCYHGDKSHGVGAVEWKDFNHGQTWSGCSGFSFTREEVKQICLHQIHRSDMVFAYIDDPTCYGTLFELGFAKSAGKTVVVMFSNQGTADDMWFVAESVDEIFVLDTKHHVVHRHCSYVDEAVHIANLIAKGITGTCAWYVAGGQKTEEEGKFYALHCDLSSKDKYGKYLETEWWQKVRTERLKIDEFRCANCGTDKNLQVHHINYSRGWFHEDPRQDLITLCKKCHEEKVHGTGRNVRCDSYEKALEETFGKQNIKVVEG